MVRNLLTSKGIAFAVGFIGLPALIAMRVLAMGWSLDDVKRAAETEAAFHLHRDVRIGSISGNPLTGIVLRDVVIAQRDRSLEDTPFVTAEEVRVRYRGRQILDRDILPLRGIHSVEVSGLRAEVSRDPSGRWNFDDLIPKDRKPKPDRFAGTIRVRGGRVHYRDESIVTPQGIVDITPNNIDALADFADHTKLTVAGSFSGGTEPVGRVGFSGEVGLGEASYQSFDISVSGVDLPYAASYLSVPAEMLQVRGGQVSAEARVALAPGQAPAWSIRADLQNAQVSSPQHIDGTATYDGPLKVVGTSLFLDGAQVAYGSSTARVTGSVLGLDEAGGPLYNLTVRDAHIDPAELLREWPVLPEGYEITSGGPLTGDLLVTGSGAELVVSGDLTSPGLSAVLPDGTRVATEDLKLQTRVGDPEQLGGEAGVAETEVSAATGPLFDPPNWLLAKDTSLSFRGRLSASVELGAEGVRGRAQIREGYARLLDTDLASIVADAVFDAKGIDISAIRAKIDGTGLEGSGWVRYGDGASRYAFSGLLDGYPIERIGRYVDVGETIPIGDLTTRLEVTSPSSAGEPPDVVLKGRVEGLEYGELTLQKAAFAARTVAGRLEIPWLEVTDPKVSAQASGHLIFPVADGEPMRLADTRIVLKNADVSGLAKALKPVDTTWPNLAGVATFVGRINGPLDSPSWYGSVEVEHPSYERWVADHLRVGTLSGDLKEIALADLHLTRGSSAIVANGTVRDYLPEGETPADPVLDLLVRADRVDLEDVLSLAETPNEYDVSGLAYLQATVKGPVSRLVADGSVQLRDAVAAGWPVREAAVDLALVDGDLEVHDLRAAVDAGGLTAQGVVRDVFNTRYLQVTWTADDLTMHPDVQEWASRYGLAGRVSMSGTIDGPAEDFEARLYLQTDELVVGGQTFQKGSIEAAASRFSTTGTVLVDFGPVVLEGAGGLVQVAGFWDSQSGAVNASVDAAGLRFRALADLLTAWSDDPAGMAPITRAADTVGGEIFGHLDIDGQPGSLYITGTGLRLQQASYLGDTLPMVTGTVTWDQFNERVVAPEFAIIGESGIVEGRVDATLGDDGRIDGTVEGRDVLLARYAALFGGEALTGGTGSFRMVVHGETDSPAVSGTITARDLVVTLPEGLHSAIGQTLQYDSLTVQGVALNEGALTVSSILLGAAEGGLRLDDVHLPFSYREGGFVRDRGIGARLWLPRQDLAEVRPLQSLLRRWGVTGDVELDVAIGGTLARPSLNGYLAIEDGKAVYTADNGVAQRLLGGAPLTVEDVDIRVAIAPGQDSELGRITLESFQGRALGGEFSLGGGVSLVGWSPLDPRNRFDLAGQITGVQRRLFSGPNGVMDLRTAALSVVYQPETGVNALRIEDLDAGLGSGRITASGSVDLRPENMGERLGYNQWNDVTVTLDAIPVNARDLAEFALVTIGGNEADLSNLDVGHGVLDGSIAVSSPVATGEERVPATIGGEITLSDAELIIPTSLSSGGDPVLWSLEREDFVLSDLKLLVGKDVNVPLLDAPLSGAATASGSLRRPSLSGVFSGAGGGISVLGRTWDIDRFGLSFEYAVSASSELELDANLDVQAGTYVAYRGRNTRVQLAIRGPLGATEIQLSSEPPIPESELIQLIGTGGGGEGGGGAAAIGDALSSDLSAALGGLVSEQAVKGLVGRIREALGLEQFSLEIGEHAELSGFDIEAEVFPNLFIRVRQTNDQDFRKDEIRFGITYKLPGRGRFSLETTNTGKLQASLEAAWSF